jgi:hypothetical protein
MGKLSATVLIALCITMAISMFSGSSYAITGNSQPDNTPYVCIVILFSDAARTQPISISTGVLISPNVVLTAGHSVMGVAASVCFDKGPLTYTIDETGKIIYNTNQPIYNGEIKPYPAYTASVLAGAKPSDALKTSDVGLILLPSTVEEVTTFPSLPTSGLADSLAVKTQLQIIGYGVQYQTTPKGHGVNTWVGTIMRNSATVTLLSTNFQGSDNYLKCSANSAQGKGGIAYGDSGGPTLYNYNGESIVLAVNALVNNGNCAGVTYHTRIDNPDVLAWITGYLS